MLNLPDLNRMKVFYAVYQAQSLKKAADALHITRSAVSQALKALEDELGSILFIRDSKKVLATEPARLLFRSLEPFFSELSSTLHQLETGRKEPVGHLRVGAPQDFGSTHLTETIVAFRRQHPRVTFELVLATPLNLLEQLSAGGLDIAFVDNGDVHAKNYPVSIVTVRRENFIPVCSKSYLEQRVGRSLKFSQIKEQAFIDYFPHAPVSKMWIKYHFGKTPPLLNVVFSAESVRALIRAAEGDLGIAIVPEHLVEDLLRSGRLKRVAASERDLVNQIVLARRLERPVTAREKAFVEFYKARRSI